MTYKKEGPLELVTMVIMMCFFSCFCACRMGIHQGTSPKKTKKVGGIVSGVGLHLRIYASFNRFPISTHLYPYHLNNSVIHYKSRQPQRMDIKPELSPILPYRYAAHVLH